MYIICYYQTLDYLIYSYDEQNISTLLMPEYTKDRDVRIGKRLDNYCTASFITIQMKSFRGCEIIIVIILSYMVNFDHYHGLLLHNGTGSWLVLHMDV